MPQLIPVGNHPTYQYMFDLEPLAGRLATASGTLLRWESETLPGSYLEVEGRFTRADGRWSGTVSSLTHVYVEPDGNITSSAVKLTGLSVPLSTILDEGSSGDWYFLSDLLDGDDTLTGSSARGYLAGGAGNDILRLGAEGGQAFGDRGDDRLTGSERGDRLGGDDRFQLGRNGGNDSLDGLGGNDVLEGGPGNDILLGGAGDDWLWDQEGNDTINGGAGDDVLTFDLPSGSESTKGYLINASAIGSGGTVRVQDGWGTVDTVTGIERARVNGSRWADTITGSAGDDTLYGGAGDDLLAGGPGRDVLHPWYEGRDYVLDDETMIGGAGDDVVSLLDERRSSFAATYENGVLTLRRRNADATLTLREVEDVRFSDAYMVVAEKVPLVNPEELILRHASGGLVAWDPLEGSAGFTWLGRPAASISMAGTLGRNDSRENVVLSLSDGRTVTLGPPFDPAPTFEPVRIAAGFEAVATGRFTGDNNEDLLLKDKGGNLRFHDLQTGSSTPFLTLRPGYEVVGTGFFGYFSFGPTSIIFQNRDTGALLQWTEGYFKDLLTLAPGSGWRLQAIGDFGTDDDDDFLFYNIDTRTLIIWDGSIFSRFFDLFTLGAGWEIAGTGDVSGDMQDDIILRNASTGNAIYWDGWQFVDLGNVLARVDLVGVAQLG
ncbi:MAG TPA: calcium-binding protein [Azospirillaceae bacterium]|nr:calcium-binding protein [Azospirillaceae bacterium]